MKRIPAILASLFVTALIGAAMFVVAGGALLNKNSLPVLDSPQQSAVSASAAAPSSAELNQLQQRILEYQAREKQYQSELNAASQQLDQTNQELQQYQQLFIELQRRGVIRVDRSGQILIPRGSFDDDGRSQNGSGSQAQEGFQS